jgi:hypothetical protein
MAEAPPGVEAPPVGAHTFDINSDEGDTNAENACGQCHTGLTTTDRIPLVPVDYNGDGYTSGVQTEVGGLLAIVQNEILETIPSTSYDAEEQRISIDEGQYFLLPFDWQAVLYNFNICSEEKSKGIHNTKYVVAVLQRTYWFISGRTFGQDYPAATLVDNFTAVRPQLWRLYQ